jgi:hypothetical protein
LCCFRYHKYKDKAWKWSEILTPHGKKLCENAFAKINPRDYAISVEQTLERISCTITRYSSNTTNTCWFLTEYKQGSHFGSCSCGRPSTNGIPCDHICAVVKSHSIDGLTETNVMPTWWHTSSWCKQYPKESTVRCTDIQTLKNTCTLGSNTKKLYVLCPPYSAPKKSGHLMAAKRIKGSIEISLDKKKGKKGKKVPMELEDEDSGKKKHGHSSSPAKTSSTPNKKAKTNENKTPMKKWKFGYKTTNKSKSPKNKKKANKTKRTKQSAD